MAAWIFQANPDQFSIDAYLREPDYYSPYYWRFSGAKRDEAVPGDQAFIWRAQGKSKSESGVVAVGTLISAPHLADLSTLRSRGLWTDPPGPGEVDFVVQIEIEEVRLTRPEGMVPKVLVEGEPLFHRHRLFTVRNRTTFPLSREQATRLRQLWDSKKVRPTGPA